MPRLFVAVWPPPDILDRLDALPRPAEAGVRWQRRDQWHVTLRFLGDVDPAATREALAGLDSRGAEVTLGPRVERLGESVVVVPAAGLDELAAAVQAATLGVRPEPDSHAFVGHLTLARLGAGATCSLEGHPVAGSFRVREVTLVESALEPQSVRYKITDFFPLE